MSKKCDKYIENGLKITVPSDYYQEVINTFDNDIYKLKKQIKDMESQGKSAELIKVKQQKIDEISKRKSSIKKGEVASLKIDSHTKNPKLELAKDVVKDAHNAGKSAASLALILSIINKVIIILKDEKKVDFEDIKKSSKDVIKDTGVAYLSTALVVTINGVLKNCKNKTSAFMVESNLPMLLANIAQSIIITINKLVNDEINEDEFFMEICEIIKGKTSAELMSLIIKTGMPINVLKNNFLTIIISIVLEYAITTYNNTKEDAKLAYEYQLKCEKESKILIEELRINNEEFKKIIDKHMVVTLGALYDDNKDQTQSYQLIANMLGRKEYYKNSNEIEAFMLDNKNIDF